MDRVQSRPSCATWKTLCRWWRFLWFTITDNYLPISSQGLKRKEKWNYGRLWKCIQDPVNFMRTPPHKSADLSRISLLNGCRPFLKGKELIGSKVTRVKLSNQTLWPYINNNKVMHKDLVMSLLLVKKKKPGPASLIFSRSSNLFRNFEICRICLNSIRTFFKFVGKLSF